MAKLICGLLRLDGNNADPSDVERLISTMVPVRRRSTKAVAASGPVGFGVLDISPDGVTPEAVAIHDLPNGGLLVADTLIYDWGDALAAVDAPSPGWTGLAESGAALASAIAKGGVTNTAAKLNADFCFATWEPDQRSLSLVRDHYGVRALAYAHRPGEWLAFASDPSALVDSGFASRTLDLDALAVVPISSDPLGSSTPYKEIRLLEAAEILEIGPADPKPSIRRYWRQRIDPKIGHETRPEEAVAEVRRLLQQAVKRRLPPEGRYAAEMSAGLDSGPIAVIAARMAKAEGRRLQVFCDAETDPEPGIPYVDESAFVEETAAAEGNIDITFLGFDPDVDMGSVRFSAANLRIENEAEPLEKSLRMASDAGVLALLSGFGGDECVSYGGRGVEAEMLLHGKFKMLMRELRARRERHGIPIWRSLLTLVVTRILPESWDRFLRRKLGLKFDHGPKSQSLEPFAARSQAIAAFDQIPGYENGPNTRINRRSRLEYYWGAKRRGQEANLAAREGVQYVYPMLDRDLLDYCCRLPGHMFKRDTITRRLIRDVAEDLLPESVRMNEVKLTPHPLHDVKVLRQKASLQKQVKQLRHSPLARELINLNALEDFIAALPDPEHHIEELRSAFEKDEHGVFDYSNYHAAFLLGHFLVAEEQRGRDVHNT